MSDKWVFGFITLWIVLCAGKPDVLDAIIIRIQNQNESSAQVKELELSLIEHKARENMLVKALYSKGLLDDRDYFEMLRKSME